MRLRTLGPGCPNVCSCPRPSCERGLKCGVFSVVGAASPDQSNIRSTPALATSVHRWAQEPRFLLQFAVSTVREPAAWSAVYDLIVTLVRVRRRAATSLSEADVSRVHERLSRVS